MRNKFLLFMAIALVILVGGCQYLSQSSSPSPAKLSTHSQTQQIPLIQPSKEKTLKNNYHIFQTFNNCGPAALSMALNYYGIYKDQQTLGEMLRPYQNAQGNNDDKSVTLEEMAEKAKEYNLIAYHRPNGNIKMIKLFITYDIPVITRTWLKKDENIGHYRVVKGFNEPAKQITQDDSLQGKNLLYSYEEFYTLWEKFNFEYLVLVPKDKKEIAETILGKEKDEKISWQNAVSFAEGKLRENPEDVYARFNLSVALYHIGKYQKSVKEFEKVENKLSFRTLWYQIEPILAYYKLKQYERVFSVTENILRHSNMAFSELYLIRGNIYKEQGDKQKAKEEFEKAVLYNKHLKEAQKALDSLN